MQTRFIINNRFEIDASRGLVHDHESGQSSRIEPRLMKLLCLLAANHGSLVSRERITKEVWDDYGNADEGLTQAISYLRKVLGDEPKKLIETVPKKGYILHAQITELVETLPANAAEKNPTSALSKKSRKWLIGITLLVCVLSLYFFVRHIERGTDHDPVKNSADVLQKTTDSGTEQRVPQGPDVVPDTLRKNANGPDLKP